MTGNNGWKCRHSSTCDYIPVSSLCTHLQFTLHTRDLKNNYAQSHEIIEMASELWRLSGPTPQFKARPASQLDSTPKLDHVDQGHKPMSNTWGHLKYIYVRFLSRGWQQVCGSFSIVSTMVNVAAKAKGISKRSLWNPFQRPFTPEHHARDLSQLRITLPPPIYSSGLFFPGRSRKISFMGKKGGKNIYFCSPCSVRQW